jgi:hypothetical protein
MKQIESSLSRSVFIIGSVFVISLFLCPTLTFAQAPANFSGVWLQDTLKSDDFYKKFDVKYTITQTPQTFIVKQTFSDKSGKELVTRDYSFTMDGKVTNHKKDYGTEKNFVKWSADKKILTTQSTVTYGNEDVGFTESYSLSDNGLVLTAQKSDIRPEATPVKQIFNMKK